MLSKAMGRNAGSLEAAAIMGMIAIALLFSGCSFLQCGDAGVKEYTGFLGLHAVCNGEEYNPETKRWGHRDYRCGMWVNGRDNVMRCTQNPLVKNDKTDLWEESKNGNKGLTQKEIEERRLFDWIY